VFKHWLHKHALTYTNVIDITALLHVGYGTNTEFLSERAYALASLAISAILEMIDVYAKIKLAFGFFLASFWLVKNRVFEITVI